MLNLIYKFYLLVFIHIYNKIQMKNNLLNISLLLVLSSALVFSQSNQKYAVIGDFKLLSGNIIKDCKIGYRTFGKINEDSSNIIIYPTWFEGTTEGIESLIKKHVYIDTTKYFIIAIDALGDGISSSPSNYIYGDTVFNDLTIRDIVNSQYMLLTKYFGISHLFGAVGGSMGSMQALEWAVAYPEFIDKILAYVSSPKMSSFDLLWMNTQLNMIETSRRNGMSDKEIKKIADMITTILARTPAYVIENIKIEDFPEYLESFNRELSKVFTLDDYIVQLKAMMKHDISREYKGSMGTAAKSIKSELLIIVSETDLLVNPSEALKLADLIGAKKIVLQNNCGHLAVGCEIERCKKEIADFFSKE